MIRPYYEQDGITIYHGDCRDILPELSLQDVLVLTDPPYGVTYQSNSGGHRGKEPITNDGTRLSLALYRQVVPLLAAQSAAHVLWFTRWDAWPDVWTILGQFFPIRGLLVWDKGTPGMGDLNHWGPSYELIASVGRGKTMGSSETAGGVKEQDARMDSFSSVGPWVAREEATIWRQRQARGFREVMRLNSEFGG